MMKIESIFCNETNIRIDVFVDIYLSGQNCTNAREYQKDCEDRIAMISNKIGNFSHDLQIITSTKQI